MEPERFAVLKSFLLEDKGALTYDEAAAVLGISPATVDRDLRFAKAWLYRELGSTS